MPLLSQWKEQKLISENSYWKLSRLTGLILEWNPKINLTGFRTRDQIEKLLIGESLFAWKALALEREKILDFGSGAGIPGLVWAICEPEVVVTSLEIRQKKVAFQKEVVRTLGLRAEVLSGHFPEAVKGRRFDLIVSRAIRLSPTAWKQAGKLLEKGGRLVRFARRDASEPGWQPAPISSHSALLIRTASNCST